MRRLITIESTILFALARSSIFLTQVAFAQQSPVPLTLAQAEQTALSTHPAIASANFIARAAGQVPLEYGAALKPTVVGNATGVGADAGSRIAAGALNNPTVYNRVAAGLTVNQMVTDFGRTSELVKSARLRADAENQNVATVRATVLMEVDRAYFNLQRASAVLQIAQQTVTARQLVSDQVTQLAANKLKSQLDVSFANVNLAQSKLDAAAAQNDVKAAQAELALAMGISVQPFVLREEPVPAGPPADDSAFLSEAIQKRPELARLRLNAEAAQRFLKAEKDLNRPTIALIATAGVVPAGDAQVPNRYGAIGANVTIPIFNGGLFKARQNEAALQARAAKSDVTDLENRVMHDVRVAYLNAVTAYQRIQLTDQLLKQAQLTLDLATGRYQLGLSSIVELSQAQLNLTSAQIASAAARYDYQTQHDNLLFQAGELP